MTRPTNRPSIDSRPLYCALILLACSFAPAAGATVPLGPYEAQVTALVAQLDDRDPAARAAAVEALGFLRAYRAEPVVAARLADPAVEVRRRAAAALAWCGGRASVARLLSALDDPDWVTRQSAYIALTNLTGMEYGFNSTASPDVRAPQADRWRRWWAQVSSDRPPDDVIELLVAPPGVAGGRQQRGLRALGTLGGEGASRAVLAVLRRLPLDPASDDNTRAAVRAAIAALGRLGGEPALAKLIELLGHPYWARHAAEALGDLGDRRAVVPLCTAYLRFSKGLDGADPRDVPADDAMSFPSEDRMLETPFAIAFALCRLPLDAPEDRAALRQIAPRVMANLPGDFDTFMLYEPEVGHRLTQHLMEHSGRIAEARQHLFAVLEGPEIPPILTDASPPAGDGQLAEGQTFQHEGGQTFLSVPHTRGFRPNAFDSTSSPTDKNVCPPPFAVALTALQRNNAPVWPTFPTYRMASWLPAVCTDRRDLPRLVALLDHRNGWVRLNAAKALGFLGDSGAIAPIAERLARAKSEADYGYSGQFKDDEYNDPSPRWREGLIRALGALHAEEHAALVARILNDERSVLEIRYAAAETLAQFNSPQAETALREAAASHSFHSVRNIARDALRARGRLALPLASASHAAPTAVDDEVGRIAARVPSSWSDIDAVLFIQGDNDVPNTKFTVEQADRWRQTYVVTDEGPAYRPGDNLFVLRPPRPDGRVTPLTRFTEGYVADPEVSWDGTQVVFAHRRANDPWWHLYRIRVDGTGLVQLTHGPYHDVGAAWLPDGRIVFSTSRSGVRDEYHAYPCTALWVLEHGGAMRPLAINIGRDNEPAVLGDGRIVLSRLEVFYSRNKTELTLHAVHPDGTGDVVLYGPERRAFWRDINHGDPDPADVQESPLTHRVLRMTQPQPMPDGRHIVVSTQAGLALVGPRRDTETLLTTDFRTRAYTTPFPLPDGTILCASTLKTPDRAKVDLGIYRFDPALRRLELVYNDPKRADYEARPIAPRRPPPVRPEEPAGDGYSGRFLCASVFASQQREVADRGRWIRVIEGVPKVGRHNTQQSPWPVWQNHGGTLARVLGTAPLAPDGSFYVQTPADRLLHLQVLDSDRRVVGNQLTWMSPRPGETRSCVGCHEPPHATPVTIAANGALPTEAAGPPIAARFAPLSMLPTGREFRYRAKAWFKGSLPAEIDQRTRTVHAVNLLAR